MVADGSAALSTLRVDVDMMGHVEKEGGGTDWRWRCEKDEWRLDDSRRMEGAGDASLVGGFG